ncbi:MAG: T9SS type A sorting domain-containing protein [Flavobacteriales bacterium]
MQQRIRLSPIAFFCLALAAPRAAAQPCTILANAVVGPTLISSAISQPNRSAVAYNPTAGLYYTVDAGNNGFEIDTHNGSYTLVNSIAGGFDYRGCWWNEGTNQLEGNGYANSGIFVQALQGGTQYPTGTGAVILAAAQPDVQSVAAFDPDANEIVYYYSNAIYRYTRATNALLGTVPITGLPLGSLNWTSVAFIGCAGHEIGIYDYTNRRVLFINKSTGAYVGSCQLPASAPQRDAFGMSYSNGIFWLYDISSVPYIWRGYYVVDSNVGIAETAAMTIDLFPNPAGEMVNVAITGAVAYTVYDMLGRTVRSGPVLGGASSFPLDVRDLVGGTYAIEAASATEAMRRMFVVAH